MTMPRVVQANRLMDLYRQVSLAIDVLRDAASTSFMHDARNAIRALYKLITADNVRLAWHVKRLRGR